MTATQLTTFREHISALYVPASSDDFAGSLALSHPEMDLRWPSGTTANTADRFWCDIGRTIATATNDDLDLRALTAANSPSGTAIIMAEIRAILIFWRAENTTTATLQPGAANGWTALGASFLKTIQPGTYERMVCGKDGGYPTGAADKVLRIANSSGATATYDIAIIGVSA